MAAALRLLLARAGVKEARPDVVLLEQLSVAKQLVEAQAAAAYVAALAGSMQEAPGVAFFQDWQRRRDAEVTRLEQRFTSLAASAGSG